MASWVSRYSKASLSNLYVHKHSYMTYMYSNTWIVKQQLHSVTCMETCSLIPRTIFSLTDNENDKRNGRTDGQTIVQEK